MILTHKKTPSVSTSEERIVNPKSETARSNEKKDVIECSTSALSDLARSVELAIVSGSLKDPSEISKAKSDIMIKTFSFSKRKNMIEKVRKFDRREGNRIIGEWKRFRGSEGQNARLYDHLWNQKSCIPTQEHREVPPPSATPKINQKKYMLKENTFVDVTDETEEDLIAEPAKEDAHELLKTEDITPEVRKELLAIIWKKTTTLEDRAKMRQYLLKDGKFTLSSEDEPMIYKSVKIHHLYHPDDFGSVGMFLNVRYPEKEIVALWDNKRKTFINPVTKKRISVVNGIEITESFKMVKKENNMSLVGEEFEVFLDGKAIKVVGATDYLSSYVEEVVITPKVGPVRRGEYRTRPKKGFYDVYGFIEIGTGDKIKITKISNIPIEDRKYKLTVRLDWPTEGMNIRSRFGIRYHPIKHRYLKHKGVDIAPVNGNLDIKVTYEEGVVSTKSVSTGYGKSMSILHPGGIETFYAHLNRFYLKNGDIIKDGKVFRNGKEVTDIKRDKDGRILAGQMGTTGSSTGIHLHYEIRKVVLTKWGDKKTPINPLEVYRVNQLLEKRSMSNPI